MIRLNIVIFFCCLSIKDIWISNRSKKHFSVMDIEVCISYFRRFYSRQDVENHELSSYQNRYVFDRKT
jgi:hypothetical protein